MSVAIIRSTDTYDYNTIDGKEEVIAGYAAAVLEQAGINCRVFDFKLTDCTISDVIAYAPKAIVCVVRHPGDNLYYTRRFVRNFRAKLATATPHVTLFGHSSVAINDNLERHGFDSIVTGEEFDLLNLVKKILENHSIDGLSGVARLSADGIIVSERPSTPPDLDKLPWPKRYFLSVDSSGSSTAAMQTSRGCYARCSFCFLESTKKSHGGTYRWRPRSLDDVCDEIEHIIKNYGVRHFYFYDTDFFGPGRANRTRGEEFAAKVLERELNINFFLYTRASDITEKGLIWLKEAGLASVFIGIESFSQAVLDRYKKDSTRELNLAAIELCKKHEIFMHIGYISYDYYTNFDELRDTVSGWKLVLANKAHLLPSPQFLFTLIAPLDGTPIAEEYHKAGFLEPNPKYPFPSWIIADLKMKSPLASYTFQDHRVGVMAECTRLMSYELTVKIVEIHKALAAEISSLTSDDALPESRAPRYIDFLSNVSVFAIDVFETAMDMAEIGSDVRTIADRLFNDCSEFYNRTLPQSHTSLEIYDKHYLPLRRRVPGYVEANFDVLLETDCT